VYTQAMDAFVVKRTEFSSSTLTPREAAEAVGLSPETLKVYRYRGTGPKFLKVGKHVRYRIADLQGWLDNRVQI
jgi:predicted DNA-binding transcriptional regulator AlpA